MIFELKHISQDCTIYKHFENNEKSLNDFKADCDLLMKEAACDIINKEKDITIDYIELVYRIIDKLPRFGYKLIELPTVAYQDGIWINDACHDTAGLFSKDMIKDIIAHNKKAFYA